MKKETISILGLILIFYSFISILNIGLAVYSNDYDYIQIGISLVTILSLFFFLFNKKNGVIIFLGSQIINLLMNVLLFSGIQNIINDLIIIVVVLFLYKYDTNTI